MNGRVAVVLDPQHVNAIRDARNRLELLTRLGVQVEPLCDELTEILDRVNDTVGTWEPDGYDTDDPKHPEFHSVRADLWDTRAGK